MNQIGVLLKQNRTAKRLSVREVAARLGIAESTYRDWENGRKIQGEPYQKISKVLDIPLSTLLGIEEMNVSEILAALTEIETQIRNIRSRVRPLL